MKFIDLSVPIKNDTLGDMPMMIPKIKYQDHMSGAEEATYVFRKLIPKKHLHDGKAWATETVTLSTHSGTHMDAPYHYAIVQDREIGVKKALTIDEFPLEWGIGPLIVLDCTEYEEGYVLTPHDVKEKLDKINHQLQKGDILCIHTNAPEYFATQEYLKYGVGVGKEATLYIIRQGVHVVGTDSWGWDAPFLYTARIWKKMIKAGKPDPSIIWEGHFAGRELGYFQMEKLTNLDKVPPVGAIIYCFPIKIERASAGWVRAVAMIPE